MTRRPEAKPVRERAKGRRAGYRGAAPVPAGTGRAVPPVRQAQPVAPGCLSPGGTPHHSYRSTAMMSPAIARLNPMIQKAIWIIRRSMALTDSAISTRASAWWASSLASTRDSPLPSWPHPPVHGVRVRSRADV